MASQRSWPSLGPGMKKPARFPTPDLIMAGLVALLVVILTPVSTLLVGLLTLRHQRSRELRETRRAAYVEWLIAARRLPYWDEEQPPAGVVKVANQARKRELNDLTAELHILASPAVIQAVNHYIDFVAREDLASQMGGPFKNADEMTDAFGFATSEVRRRVVDAMRADLGVTGVPPEFV